jgi:diacylglycerol kinase (ATP)
VRKIFVVVNPVSGKMKSLRILTDLRMALEKHGIDYGVFETTEKKDAWHLVSVALDSTFTDLIIVGGDGTINQAVNGMSHDIPIGLLAAGTGNDYVKCFNLGAKIEDQIQTAIFGNPVAVDVGLCNGRKFLNGVGIGFDGQIVADMLQKRTVIQGPAKYYYHVLKNLAGYTAKKFEFERDGAIENKDLILLCIAKGTTFGGSFRLTPKAQLSDGFLHVCEIAEMSPSKRFLNINRLQSGTHHELEEVQLSKALIVNISHHSQLNAHMDGEYFGKPPFDFGILPNAVKIRCISLVNL